MNSIFFIDEAYEELREAVKYYNIKRPGPGFELANEIKATLSKIRLNPDMWIEITPGIGRCMVRRFSYSFLCYWKTRIQE